MNKPMGIGLRLFGIYLFFSGGLWASAPRISEGAVSKKCVALLTQHRSNELPVVPGSSVAYDAQAVVFKGNYYRDLQVEYDEFLKTVRYFPKHGRFLDSAEVIFPEFHGNGTPHSHSGAMLRSMNVFTSLKHKKGSLIEALKAQNEYLHASAEAIDFPGHGIGPFVEKSPAMHLMLSWIEDVDRTADYVFKLKKQHPDEETSHVPVPSLKVVEEGLELGVPLTLGNYETIDDTIDWIAIELKQLRAHNVERVKKGLKAIPIVPIARSGSTGILIALNQKYPELLDGMILVSPVHPIIDLEESIFVLLEDSRHRNFEINRTGLAWMTLIYLQMRKPPYNWHEKMLPFGKTPTLIFVGGTDLQVPPAVRHELQTFMANYEKEAAEKNQKSRVWYHEVPTAGHDVISPLPREQAFPVYEKLYAFVRECVLSNLK